MSIVGIDEVGRGCWAGPLVAGAVILDKPIRGLNDSKKLSKRQREKLAAEIQIEAGAIGLGWVSAEELDKVGITTAVKLAMERALKQITTPYDEVIIDGNINYLPAEPRAKAVIKADATVPAVSAASIVAKVARDAYMAQLDDTYAVYGFEKHVGYGTAAHVAALQQFGVSDIHRRSFKPIKALLEAA
ncbi:MAG TPA: ribonuclease HII [Candidatus Saccharimonadales bacterium]|nr:ribonuclease HII [Candidatus Saccharimonadales bacterium]